MGVQMPRDSRELLPLRAVSAVRPSARVSWWWVGAVVAGAASLLLLFGSVERFVRLSASPWVLPPLLAAVGWAYAARSAESRRRPAFRAFQGAAIIGAGAHLVRAYQYPADPVAAVPDAPSLLLLPPIAIAVGAALVLGLRQWSVWAQRLMADAALLFFVVTAVALRLVVEPAIGGGQVDPLRYTVLTALCAATVVPVFLTTQVVLRRGTALPSASGFLLLAATLAFATGALISLPRLGGELLAVPAPSEHLALAGWLLFAAAGYSARHGLGAAVDSGAAVETGAAGAAQGALPRRPAIDAVRKFFVPGCALVLAVGVVDMGMGRPPRPDTVLAMAMLALALAVRTGQTFNIADRESTQRRQLTHTRALVAVTHALAGTTDLDEALRVISESARVVLGTEGAGIELLTGDGQALEARSVVGLPREVVGLRFPLEGSFTGWVVQHEEPRATVDPSRDPYIQPQSLSFLGRSPLAAAPIHFRGETLGALFACIRSEPFDAEELELMGALAQQAAIAIQQARLFEQVTVMSITDPLTGVANRRQLEHELTREFAAARRGRDLAVVMFDLDRFKKYNDAHGHLVGDEALQAFARSLQEETRSMNLAARYGGDEFVAVLAGTDAAGARAFIARVRAQFARRVEEIGYGPLSVSAGLAQFTPEMARPDELLRAADDELYRTKPHARA